MHLGLRQVYMNFLEATFLAADATAREPSSTVYSCFRMVGKIICFVSGSNERRTV